jgi:hypothetical protein
VELGHLAALATSIDRLRAADNADKQDWLAQLEGAHCQGEPQCALKDLCLQAYRLHQRALDTIASLKTPALAARDAPSNTAERLEAARSDLASAQQLAHQCAERQVLLVRKSMVR